MSRILDMLREADGIDEEYHPLVEIVKISTKADEDLRLELDCHRTIAKYVEAELKSIEIKPEGGGNLFRMSISLDGDEQEESSEEDDGA